MNTDTDEIGAHELSLYTINDAELYRRRATPIIHLLQKKVKKGTYDKSKSLILWKRLADEAAKKYSKEFGGSFDVPTKKRTAQELSDHYDEQVHE